MTSNFVKGAIAALATMLISAVSFAQSEQLIDGTIVDNNVQNNRGTLTIRKASNGQQESYRVTPETELDVQAELNFDSVLSTAYPPINDISDLMDGDQVKLNIREDADGWVIIGFSRNPSANDPSRAAYAASNRSNSQSSGSMNRQSSSGNMMARNNSYDSLPGTASNLPLLAILAAIALAGSAGIRAVRKRS